jgi:hypothetical protein
MLRLRQFRPPQRGPSHFLCLCKESDQRNTPGVTRPRLRHREAPGGWGLSTARPCADDKLARIHARNPDGLSTRPEPLHTGAPRAERKQDQEPREASLFTAAWIESRSQSAKLALVLALALALALARRKRALWLFNRGPCAAARRRRKARRGARMDAREFFVGTRMCRRRTPQPPRVPDFAGTQNQARHRGVLLFGYFLLDKQEKVTRPPLRGTKLAKSQLQNRGKRNASIGR